jgi:putative ABC transport system permease protein
LVVAEVALAFVLLAGTGLMIRTFYRLQQNEPGYHATHLFSARLDVAELKKMTPEMRRQKTDAVMARIEAIPGVSSVAMTQGLPNEYSATMAWQILGAIGTENRDVQAVASPVSPRFIETLGLPLRAGQTLVGARESDAPVAVVNEAFAREYFGGANPVGQQLVVGKAQWEIVGMVGDARSMRAAAKPTVYFPEWQRMSYALQLLIRTEGIAADGLGAQVRKAVYEIDAALVLADFESVEKVLAREINMERQAYGLLRVMSGLALLLAGFGLAAMMVYTVAQRFREIGVRMALGATPAMIRDMVYRRGLVLVGAGVLTGIALTWALSRFLESLLYETPAFDPMTYGVTAVVMVVMAGLACALPAWRAAKVNLTQLLRAE